MSRLTHDFFSRQVHGDIAQAKARSPKAWQCTAPAAPCRTSATRAFAWLARRQVSTWKSRLKRNLPTRMERISWQPKRCSQHKRPWSAGSQTPSSPGQFNRVGPCEVRHLACFVQCTPSDLCRWRFFLERNTKCPAPRRTWRFQTSNPT